MRVSALLATPLLRANKSVILAKTPPRALICPVWMNHQLSGRQSQKVLLLLWAKTSGGGSGYAWKEPDLVAVPIDGHFPGDGTVPKSAVAFETVNGRVAYAGTPEKPILKYQDCVTPAKAGKPVTQIWMVDMLRAEQEGPRNAKKPIGTVTSPCRGALPRLPMWASPNGWDYWGRRQGSMRPM